MSNFWGKALGVPSSPAPRPHWSAPQAPAAAPQTPPGYGGYQPPQNLAVAAPAASQDQAGAVAAQQGYISKPPEWMQKQPTDKCPQCGGTEWFKGQGNYASRCYDCSYIEGRTQSDGQIGNAYSGNVASPNARITSTRQPHGLKNFSRIG